MQRPTHYKVYRRHHGEEAAQWRWFNNQPMTRPLARPGVSIPHDMQSSIGLRDPDHAALLRAIGTVRERAHHRVPVRFLPSVDPEPVLGADCGRLMRTACDFVHGSQGLRGGPCRELCVDWITLGRVKFVRVHWARADAYHGSTHNYTFVAGPDDWRDRHAAWAATFPARATKLRAIRTLRTRRLIERFGDPLPRACCARRTRSWCSRRSPGRSICQRRTTTPTSRPEEAT